MKILIIENDRGLEEAKKTGLEFEEIIDISKETPYIISENISNDEKLKFLDFLIERISLDKKLGIHYFGEELRVWSYLSIFSTLGKDIVLFYRDEKIEDRKVPILNLNYNGIDAKQLKKELEIEEYSVLPENIKSLYYNIENKMNLSKLGEIYVRNIKG